MTLEEIQERARMDLFGAAEQLMRALMHTDINTFKLGYSLGNAMIATAERLEMSMTQMAVVLDRMDVDLPKTEEAATHEVITRLAGHSNERIWIAAQDIGNTLNLWPDEEGTDA